MPPSPTQQFYSSVQLGKSKLHVIVATKRMKIREETISDILVADCDSESGAEASDVEEN